MKLLNALAFIAFIGGALFTLAFMAFKAAPDISTVATYAATTDERRTAKARYIAENCKITGYYGRYGEHKTYDCHGQILRESDI